MIKPKHDSFGDSFITWSGPSLCVVVLENIVSPSPPASCKVSRKQFHGTVRLSLANEQTLDELLQIGLAGVKIRNSSNNPSANGRHVKVRLCADFVHHNIRTSNQKNLVRLPPGAINTTHRVTVSCDFQPSPLFNECQAPSGKQI